MAADTPRLVVQDSVEVARFRLALAAPLAIFAVYIGLRPDQDHWVSALLLGSISVPLTFTYLNQMLRPRTLLILDAGGIWTADTGGLTWAELRAYRSSYYPSLDSATEDLFIFIRQDGSEIAVDLETADTDIDAIRRFIAQLPPGPPLRDLGHNRR